MHTAICSFDDQAQAQQAVDRLVQAGFDRGDVHLTHRHADGTEFGHDSNDAWDGMEREVAVDRKVIERFGHFFGRLFGKDDADGHVDTYSGAVERGLYVVVVDGRDEADAQRAQSVLHGMNAADLNLVHRPAHPPLRDIVGARQAADMERSFGTARSEMSAAPEPRRETEAPRERAVASQGWGEQRTLELRDQPEPDDVDHAPGLRYADKDSDKPR